METNKPFIVYPLDFNAALALVSMRLVAAGFYIGLSFEMDSACASFTQDYCPHIEEGPCGCRLGVLHVQAEDAGSLHLILHGYDDRSEFYLTNHEHSDLAARITQVLKGELETIRRLVDKELGTSILRLTEDETVSLRAACNHAEAE